RRHTRFSRDWSSDVSSSDLARRADCRSRAPRSEPCNSLRVTWLSEVSSRGSTSAARKLAHHRGTYLERAPRRRPLDGNARLPLEIGRASGRERVAEGERTVG